jgi:hypothetical protein
MEAVKLLPWIAAGGIATGLFFLMKRTEAAPLLPPNEPPKTYGEATKVALAVPAGWRRATSAEVSALPELGSHASALVNSSGFTSMAYGTLAPFLGGDGRMYATWIEQHYHEPGGAAKPWGLHHGVTLLAQAGSGSLLDEWSGPL